MPKQMTLAACLAAAALPFASSAAAQDGWAIERPGRNQISASTVFSTGQAVALRCTRRQAEVVVIGLPPALKPEDGLGSTFSRRIETSVDGRRLPASTWLVSADPKAAFYTGPAMLMRAMLTGQELTLRVMSPGGPATRIVLRLPEDRSGLETVFEECGLPRVDTRDGALDLSARPTEESPDTPSRPILTWKTMPRAGFPELAINRGVDEGLVVVSCIAQPDGLLRDCRSDYAAPAGYGFDGIAMAAMRNARLEPRDDPEDRAISFTMRFITE